jgi:hypothetical protein
MNHHKSLLIPTRLGKDLKAHIPAIIALVQQELVAVEGYHLMSEADFFALIERAHIPLCPLDPAVRIHQLVSHRHAVTTGHSINWSLIRLLG